MNTSMTELNMNEMEMVNGGLDTATKASLSGLSFASGAITGGILGSLGGPIGTFVGAAVGGAVGGISAAVAWLKSEP